MAVTIQSVFTQRQENFLIELKRIVPRPFLNSSDEDEHTKDYKLLGVGQLALFDYNNFQPGPRENFNFNSLPQDLIPLIVFGTNFYIAVLRRQEYSLIDIQYNAAGLSLGIDRVSKIGSALETIEKPWLRMIENRKKNVLLANGGVGLATPRFSSSMSRMIVSLGLGTAFGWNIP